MEIQCKNLLKKEKWKNGFKCIPPTTFPYTNPIFLTMETAAILSREKETKTAANKQ